MKRSVRTKIIIAVTLVQIPVILLYFFIVNNFISHFLEQQWDYQNNELLRFITSTQDEFKAVDEYLFYDCYEILKEEDPDVLRDAYIQSADNIMENSIILGYTALYDENGQTVYSAGNTEMEEVCDAAAASKESINEGWFLQKYGEEWYQIRTVSLENRTVSAVVSLERLAASATNHYHISGTVLLAGEDTYYTSTLWQRNAEEEIPLEINSPYQLTVGERTYLLSQSRLLGMKVLYGVIYRFDLKWLYMFGWAMIAVAAASLGVTIFYLGTSILHPMGKMTRVMKQIGEGDMEQRLPEGKSQELEQISTSFNDMMDKLKDAKIESYEHQLTARRAKVDALRLQIRRHFFLNCLKNIYAMASTGDVAGVKQTALLLSTNLRYTLNFDNDSVPLKKELAMCEDYIRLQGIGQPIPPLLLIESDPQLDNFEIPPVSMLTILENCCKYGTKPNEALIITMHTSIKELDDKKYAIITIRDNGNGYDEEMLKQLNRDLNKVQENNHIGMANTLLRFRMLYGEDCSVLFSNSSGAKVELMIPMERKEEVGI